MIKRLAITLGWVFLGALMATGFMAYKQPSLILENANFRYCG